MAVMLAGASPALAADWYYVDEAQDGTSVTYVDKDSIKADNDGYLGATMFSMLAEAEDGTKAYRFTLVVDCAGKRSKLTGGEAFGENQVSAGYNSIPAEWQATDPGSQGDTITGFICAGGKTGAASAGAALPFDAAAKKLAEHK
ncbi:surface-adhesin E family protein [Sphingomonas sp.]|uniref:surface-adhesin E family protein n=1 Tax=Sphingomonas sp. TaxID=28214 RepID=UPI0034518BEF